MNFLNKTMTTYQKMRKIALLSSELFACGTPVTCSASVSGLATRTRIADFCDFRTDEDGGFVYDVPDFGHSHDAAQLLVEKCFHECKHGVNEYEHFLDALRGGTHSTLVKAHVKSLAALCALGKLKEHEANTLLFH